MTKLLLGTFNRNKVSELREALAGFAEVISCADLGGITEVPETGDTLEANAILKAEGYAAQTSLPCLADDSGLEVASLGGAPGVHSAYYGGEHGNAPKNIERLLRELEGVTRREARFRTVLALAIPHRPTLLFQGELLGTILLAPQGTGGFGYDPVFLPLGSTKTLAELSLTEKNALSHRGRAMAALLAHLSTRPA
jgi:XTP/dITP diphosphohydrolase